MKPSILVAVLVAGLSLPAAADVKKGAQAAAEAAPDDVICTYERSVGSHIKRRVCATRAQRDEQARADQEAMGNTQRRGKGFRGDRGPSGP